VRIGAAAKLNGLSYNQFIHGLKVAGVELDRKILADLAVRDAAAFKNLADRRRPRWRTVKPPVFDKTGKGTAFSRAITDLKFKQLVIPSEARICLSELVVDVPCHAGVLISQ